MGRVAHGTVLPRGAPVARSRRASDGIGGANTKQPHPLTRRAKRRAARSNGRARAPPPSARDCAARCSHLAVVERDSVGLEPGLQLVLGQRAVAARVHLDERVLEPLQSLAAADVDDDLLHAFDDRPGLLRLRIAPEPPRELVERSQKTTPRRGRRRPIDDGARGARCPIRAVGRGRASQSTSTRPRLSGAGMAHKRAEELTANSFFRDGKPQGRTQSQPRATNRRAIARDSARSRARRR